MKTVTRDDLDTLSYAAAAAARRRTHRNLHPSLADGVQRLLIALEPGTYVRPHRHSQPGRFELFLVVRGQALVLTFDDDGRVTNRYELDAAGALRALEIAPGTWHTLAALAPGTVLFEIKPGPYAAPSDKDFAAWAPPEGEARAPAFERWYAQAQPGVTPPR
jgi:cupin fold WbuC family metalloprotein